MQLFQTKSFRNWAASEGLTNSDLLAVIVEMEEGLLGVSLGGNVYKKRVKLEGRGKSGGARTIIVYRANDKAFFIEGFAKNEKDNISNSEEKALKLLAKEVLAYTDEQIRKAVKAKVFYEIKEE